MLVSEMNSTTPSLAGRAAMGKAKVEGWEEVDDVRDAAGRR